jgi:putative addiction module CopG family antidote
MAYQLPPDLDARIQAQLATGDYPSADEVVRDALDGLERRQQSLAHLQAMVREAEEDVAAGRVGQFDIDVTMRRVENRLGANASEG